MTCRLKYGIDYLMSTESIIDKLDIEEVTEAGRRFLSYCKKFGWGKLEVTVKNGEPVMVVETRKETKLD